MLADPALLMSTLNRKMRLGISSSPPATPKDSANKAYTNTECTTRGRPKTWVVRDHGEVLKGPNGFDQE
jgi:hypothetical protein